MPYPIEVCVVGLGYVGFPLATLLAENDVTVTGYDIDSGLIDDIKQGIDHTNLVPRDAQTQAASNVTWTDQFPADIDMYIICVPTPTIKQPGGYIPDHSYVFSVAKMIADNARPGAYVILESTVSPGTTERLVSEYFAKKQHPTAYSPERVNPGPFSYRELCSENKVIAFHPNVSDKQAEEIETVYRRAFGNIITFNDPQIAELAKCFENAQRDMNIAMMNELSMHCGMAGIEFSGVLKALRTKPSSPKFVPGIVGGHCIPVDPWYLDAWYRTHKAANPNTLPRQSRDMHEVYLQNLCQQIEEECIAGGSTLILGGTYKPNVLDIRNAGGFELYNRLLLRGIDVDLHDYFISGSLKSDKMYDCVVGLINHMNTPTDLSREIPITHDACFFNVGCSFSERQLEEFNIVINC